MLKKNYFHIVFVVQKEEYDVVIIPFLFDCYPHSTVDMDAARCCSVGSDQDPCGEGEGEAQRGVGQAEEEQRGGGPAGQASQD